MRRNHFVKIKRSSCRRVSKLLFTLLLALPSLFFAHTSCLDLDNRLATFDITDNRPYVQRMGSAFVPKPIATDDLFFDSSDPDKYFPSFESASTTDDLSIPTVVDRSEDKEIDRTDLTNDANDGESTEEIHCPDGLPLSEVAASYLADTEEAAIEIALAIDFLPDSLWEHPSNMCGPLAVDILRRACLLPEGVVPHDFWLANPVVDNRPARFFPDEDYFKAQVVEAVKTFDFIDCPLLAGDFLYLFAGSYGTFAHMIVVSEIDDEGRAYSVNNIGHRNSGVTIERTMLYDPSEKEAGYFRDEWAQGYFRTGQEGGGFLLIRHRAFSDREKDEACFL